MKKFLMILLGVILLSAFGGTLYYLWSKTEEPPQVFETSTPFVTDIVKKTVASGSVIPRKEVDVKPQISGIVDKIFVEPGDQVNSGDLIARIRIIPNMLSLSSAETRVNQARIALENAELDLERNRKLRDDGIIAVATFQSFELAADNAREELDAALDNLEVIRKGSRAKSADASNTLVRATIDGMVLEVPLEEGDSVIETNTFNDGTTIVTIADMSELIFEGTVDESEVGKLRPGMELVLTIGAIDDQRFTAALERIAPKGVEENGAIQFEIRAALDTAQSGNFIRANYSANADVVLDRREQVLAIDEGLVRFDDDATWVEVQTADGGFERRDLELGLSDGINVQVVSGLAAGDAIKVIR